MGHRAIHPGEKIMTYRLLACDIDDTIVRFPDPPSPAVSAALHAAQERGTVVTLVTGRAFRRARPVAQMLSLDTPIICNHGGSIRDGRTGDMLHREVLPRALATEVVTWMSEQDVHIFVFDQDLVYHTGALDEVVPDFQVYTCGDQSFYVQDLAQSLPQETEIILCTSRDHDRLAEVHSRAAKRFGQRMRVLFSHPYGLDIMPHSSKSQALAWLAARLGIPQDSVMAVGDGNNDVDMLLWAGLGIAIGDGAPDALAQADVIAPSFDQDGLAWAIHKYILGD